MDTLFEFLIFFGAALNVAGFTLTGDGTDPSLITTEQKTLINDYLKRFLLNQISEQERIQHERNILDNAETARPDPRGGWVISTTVEPHVVGEQTSWSITWYIVSFSGLIAFFVIISCSEWCCRRRNRAVPQQQQVRSTASPLGSSSTQTSASPVQETMPPPAYDLFAPPSYDSVNERRGEKTEFDVYVVPVHAIATVLEADAPPSYTAINGRNQELDAASLSNTSGSDSENPNRFSNTDHASSVVSEGAASEVRNIGISLNVLRHSEL